MRERVKHRAGLAAFLQNRRARLHPEQFHLPTFQRRRTRGLRREELAQLVGVGVSWYTWLEQGRDIQVSDQVLERLASILQLNAEERRHLLLLAQAPLPPLDTQDKKKHAPNATTQIILDGFIRCGFGDNYSREKCGPRKNRLLIPFASFVHLSSNAMEVS